MKKRYVLLFLVILLAVSTLVACTSQVRIADAPLLMPDTRATTAVPVVTTPADQAADTAATLLAATSHAATIPGTGKTLPVETKHQEGLPRIILESDEIVPVPNKLLSELNKTLDELLESIGRLESPDEDVLLAP